VRVVRRGKKKLPLRGKEGPVKEKTVANKPKKPTGEQFSVGDRLKGKAGKM